MDMVNNFYAATTKGYIQKFDRRVGKMPISQSSVLDLKIYARNKQDEHIMCMDQSSKNPHLICVAGNYGCLAMLDTRNFPSFAGFDQEQNSAAHKNCVVKLFQPAEHATMSISYIDRVGHTPPLLATAGVDKKLRIYDVATKKIKDIMFMKGRCNHVSFVPGLNIYHPDEILKKAKSNSLNRNAIKKLSQESSQTQVTKATTMSKQVSNSSLGKSSVSSVESSSPEKQELPGSSLKRPTPSESSSIPVEEDPDQPGPSKKPAVEGPVGVLAAEVLPTVLGKAIAFSDTKKDEKEEDTLDGQEIQYEKLKADPPKSTGSKVRVGLHWTPCNTGYDDSDCNYDDAVEANKSDWRFYAPKHKGNRF